jgi:hypothetical protein
VLKSPEGKSTLSTAEKFKPKRGDNMNYAKAE